jgi:adenylate kinase family enzyme
MNILILIGIPASGKSTFAKEFIETNLDYVRINRDNELLDIKQKF